MQESLIDVAAEPPAARAARDLQEHRRGRHRPGGQEGPPLPRPRHRARADRDRPLRARPCGRSTRASPTAPRPCARSSACGGRRAGRNASLGCRDRSPMSVATLPPGALEEARERTLDLVAPLSDADVETAHSALMSPLVWDLAHIAAYEDLWLVHRHGGEPLLHPELAAMYDAFETPRAVRGDLAAARPRRGADLPRGGPRARARGARPHRPRRGPRDGPPARAAAQRDDAAGDRARAARHRARARPALRPDAARGGHTGLEAVEVPGGPFLLGAPAERFALRQRAPAPRRSTCGPSGSAARRSPTRPS